jgi:hypothetical protein
LAGWQYLPGALRAPRTAMRTSNEYKIHVGGRIAVQSPGAAALVPARFDPKGATAKRSYRALRGSYREAVLPERGAGPLSRQSNRRAHQ